MSDNPTTQQSRPQRITLSKKHIHQSIANPIGYLVFDRGGENHSERRIADLIKLYTGPELSCISTINKGV